MRRLPLLCVLCAACGSSSPTAPTPTPVPPTPTTYQVQGIVTATNGGQALSGLQVDLSGQSTTTNGSGTFSYQLSAGATSRLSLTGPGIVARSVTLNVGAARTVAIGAISLSSGFDLGFYRELVRNAFEGGNEPLRRWTRAPRIYLRSVDDGGRAVPASVLTPTAGTLQTATYPWTAGLGLAAFQQGAETRDGVDGWITVHWAAQATPGQCGQTAVGVTRIDLTYLNGASCACQSTGDPIKQRTVAHELGHALGFWHTDSPADVMYGQVNASCEIQPSAREILHAAIAYARPVGNVDPDSDPVSAVSLAPRVVR